MSGRQQRQFLPFSSFPSRAEGLKSKHFLLEWQQLIGVEFWQFLPNYGGCCDVATPAVQGNKILQSERFVLMRVKPSAGRLPATWRYSRDRCRGVALWIKKSPAKVELWLRRFTLVPITEYLAVLSENFKLVTSCSKLEDNSFYGSDILSLQSSYLCLMFNLSLSSWNPVYEYIKT